MKTQLYQWLKTNRVMLINAGSLVCTTLVTGILGFAYWWVAARQFLPHAVGLASASVSAMMLLGAICVLGLGTLLIGELPRQPGKEASLISTALFLVGLVGGLVGLLFALLAPFVSADFLPLRASVASVLIFTGGISLTSITIVLDQALIGLLRGELQFWRNTLFAASKLGVLFAIALTLHTFPFYRGGVAIYATWAIGNSISLLPFVLFVLFKKRISLKNLLPDWSLLQKLGISALQHHMLNLIQQVPTTLLPVLVTVLLSATTNAWFYMAWMISGFVFTASYALTTVLYAINTAPPEEIARKIRMTLNLAFVTSLGANIVIQVGASQILGLFGHAYATQAAWCLRIVSLAAFPMIIKFHYLAVSRIHKKMLHAMLPVAFGSLIELGAAALGALLDGLLGLSIGWAVAVSIEAIFMSPAVFRATHFRPSIEAAENLSLLDTVVLEPAPVLSISLDQQATQSSLINVATPTTGEIEEVAFQLPALIAEDEMEETELLSALLLPTSYKRNSLQSLITLPDELAMQKFLDMSTAITEKRAAVKLPAVSSVKVSQKAPSLPGTSCIQCSTSLPVNASFCSNCGKIIKELDTEIDHRAVIQPIIIEEIDTGIFFSTEDVLTVGKENDREISDPSVEQVSEEELLAKTEKWSIASAVRIGTAIVLPLASLILWYTSLPGIHLQNMNDLGLISVLSPATIIPPFVLTTSFCLTMWQKKERVPLILLHILILIFMLYSITALIEPIARFAIVYRHAGYTEYIMRHGSVDPGLDAYFDWAGFFIFSAFLTRIAGYSTILSYAAWSPFFLNLIYFFPLYVIFTTATRDKRITWFGIWFFYLTNWIGQDYFSPQGLNFFLYLSIIAILLKWFKTSPGRPLQLTGPRWQCLGRLLPLPQRFSGWLTTPDTDITPTSTPQRVALLASLIAIFGLMVFSHPLTPFLTIASVTVLIILRRCRPVWLPVLMIVMTTTWIVTMAQPYLVGNLNNVIGDFSHINSVITQNVTSRALTGDKEHNFISNIRLLMTAFIWVLALLGGILRSRKGFHDITYILLATAPFPVLLVQSYGGEMLLRIYLFTLPMMTFFASAIFFTHPSRNNAGWMKVGVLLTCFVLLGAFFFTRYGNEHMDYFTSEELVGVHHLYSIAPHNSLFLEAWDGTPWEAQDFELYNTSSLGETIPEAVSDGNVNAIIHYIDAASGNSPAAYIIITRSQKITATSDGLRPGTLDHLERLLLRSKKFVQIYSNKDAQIFVFIAPNTNNNH